MKKINNKAILIIFVIVNFISCKAQEYPLNTDFTSIPQNFYLKDLNNELDPYVGTYFTTFNGNQITLFITKELHKAIDLSNKSFFRDVLIVKYIVKSPSGILLQDTQNINFASNQRKHIIYSMRTKPTLGIVSFNYGGTNCSVGNGLIYLKKLNPTQISWEYRPDDIILDSSKCPVGTDITIYLPETKDLIFTKQ